MQHNFAYLLMQVLFFFSQWENTWYDQSIVNWGVWGLANVVLVAWSQSVKSHVAMQHLFFCPCCVSGFEEVARLCVKMFTLLTGGALSFWWQGFYRRAEALYVIRKLIFWVVFNSELWGMILYSDKLWLGPVLRMKKLFCVVVAHLTVICS